MSQPWVRSARDSAPTVGSALPSTGRAAGRRRLNALSSLLNVYVVACLAGATGAGVGMLGSQYALTAVLSGILISALLLLTSAWLGSPLSQRSFRSVRDVALIACVGHLVIATFELIGGAELRVSLAVSGSALLIVAGATWVRLRFAGPSSVMLVGDRLAVAQCIDHWQFRDDMQVTAVFLVTPPMEEDTAPNADVLGVPVVAGTNNIAKAAIDTGVDTVIVAPGPLVTEFDVRRLGWALEGTSISFAVTAQAHGATPQRLRPRLVGNRVVVAILPSVRPAFVRWLKSALDRIVGSALLVLFAPLIGVFALVVRIDSPGPAFFRQTRIGKDGTPFTMFKLRTMYIDAEDRRGELAGRNQAAGPMFKVRDDPRITRHGRLLRVSSLDELPQLLNVVRGEMSLIGPRPSLPSETRSYDDWVSRRLAVKPGMTGQWQVSGRSALSWDESVGLDLGYVDNWTLSGDLLIAAKTVKAVLQRDGAS